MNERVKRLTEEFAKLAPDEQDELIDRLIVIMRKPDPGNRQSLGRRG